jgi:cytochrome c-type biogenesis protein CcmE
MTLLLIREHIPEAKHINADSYIWGEFAITYQDKSGAFNVQGCLPDLLQIDQSIEIAEGRFINLRDVQEKRKVV